MPLDHPVDERGARERAEHDRGHHEAMSEVRRESSPATGDHDSRMESEL
jgi:hypothetical protein